MWSLQEWSWQPSPEREQGSKPHCKCIIRKLRVVLGPLYGQALTSSLGLLGCDQRSVVVSFSGHRVLFPVSSWLCTLYHHLHSLIIGHLFSIYFNSISKLDSSLVDVWFQVHRTEKGPLTNHICSWHLDTALSKTDTDSCPHKAHSPGVEKLTQVLTMRLVLTIRGLVLGWDGNYGLCQGDYGYRFSSPGGWLTPKATEFVLLSLKCTEVHPVWATGDLSPLSPSFFAWIICVVQNSARRIQTYNKNDGLFYLFSN